jgi:hypothetical protein
MFVRAHDTLWAAGLKSPSHYPWASRFPPSPTSTHCHLGLVTSAKSQSVIVLGPSIRTSYGTAETRPSERAGINRAYGFNRPGQDWG